MKHLLLALFIALIALPSLPAIAEDAAAPHVEQTALKQAEAQYVCMVNDTLFDKPQIPVEVNGQTYYGCCMMCKARLEKDASIRSAIDPVSGAEVDKATAVIGANEDGAVFYFESEDNLQSYTGSLAQDHNDMSKSGMMMDDMMMDTMSDHDMSDHDMSAPEPEMPGHDKKDMPKGDSAHH